MWPPAGVSGYGIENALLGINDYAGLDVKGKIVVMLSGYPLGLPSEEAAHASATKAEAAQARGAVGIITIATNTSAKVRPWSRSLQYANGARFNWVDEDGKAHENTPGIRASAALDDDAAAALFAGPATRWARSAARPTRRAPAPKACAEDRRADFRASASTRAPAPWWR
jgi:hypothetical protein